MVTYRTLCRRCHRYALIGRAHRRWYRVARGVIRRLADVGYEGYPDVQGLRYRRFAELVAITSPRTSVARNLKFAWGEFIGHGPPSDMIRSTRQALAHYYRTGEIRGPKTSRFALVLRGDDNIAVVDTWMARALSVPDNQARNKSTQELAERVIGCVARYHGWALSEAQAAVWAGVIRTYYKDGKVPRYRTEDVGLYRTGTGSELVDVPF